MQHKNIVTRWAEAKAAHHAELTRLGEGLRLISEDIEATCGQKVTSIDWSRDGVEYTIFIATPFYGGNSGTKSKNVSRPLCNPVATHWGGSIIELELIVAYLRTIKIEDLRTVAEIKLHN